jgi:hypothetical protein
MSLREAKQRSNPLVNARLPRACPSTAFHSAQEQTLAMTDEIIYNFTLQAPIHKGQSKHATLKSDKCYLIQVGNSANPLFAKGECK